MLFSFKCRFFLNCLFSLDILINQISCGEFSGNWYRRVFTLMNPGGFQVWTAQHTPVQKCDFSVTKSAKCFTFAWVSTFNPCSILYLFVICSFPFLCFQVYADRKRRWQTYSSICHLLHFLHFGISAKLYSSA